MFGLELFLLAPLLLTSTTLVVVAPLLPIIGM